MIKILFRVVIPIHKSVISNMIKVCQSIFTRCIKKKLLIHLVSAKSLFNRVFPHNVYTPVYWTSQYQVSVTYQSLFANLVIEAAFSS